MTYNGFTAPAEAAFQHAVDLWELLVCSSQTIRVDATFAALPPNVLGSAGANFIHRDVPGLVPATWYPDALADAITGVDQSPGNPDIIATFSSTFNFYFGTDGDPAGNQYDFVTVVLHELGHGLGFFGSGQVDDGSPPAECNGPRRQRQQARVGASNSSADGSAEIPPETDFASATPPRKHACTTSTRR